ncbi:hypothetical protein L1787_02565 [Acuticoccus sp. M5D2P5]|uniref:hypothetical protein n=1 Tax=Acuticoccus kalidii TaxID=2910977 RepID=UPI001F3D88B7|nr:hypothetical protein [Acuticoccus kalidii]MCF3932296.1 hypothetical protein [Acuticoccus kalidii]
MARARLIAIALTGTMLGIGPVAAQSYDQYQNRMQLQQSQRQLDNSSRTRDFEARQRDRDIDTRIQNLDTNQRLNSPPILRQPPIVTPTR